MRALVKDNPEKGYELKSIPVPAIEADEILFRVEKVAICGSDIALYLWNEVAKVIATVPFIPGSLFFQLSCIYTTHLSSFKNLGHEATGVVIKVGDAVKDIQEGARIAIENHFFCGDCYSCKVLCLKICSLCKFSSLSIFFSLE